MSCLRQHIVEKSCVLRCRLNVERWKNAEGWGEERYICKVSGVVACDVERRWNGGRMQRVGGKRCIYIQGLWTRIALSPQEK